MLAIACQPSAGSGSAPDRGDAGITGHGAVGPAPSASNRWLGKETVPCTEEPTNQRFCVEAPFVDGPCVRRLCYLPGGDNPPGCLPGPATRQDHLSPELREVLGGSFSCFGEQSSRRSSGPYCSPGGQPSACCYLVPRLVCEGRPLFVEGAPRTSLLVRGSAW